jgi:hypothetical protein
MTRRFSDIVVTLYPRSWRRRYGDELADLCQEYLESGDSTRFRLTVGLARSAVIQRLRAIVSFRHRALVATVALAVSALVALGATTNGLGHMGGSNKGAPAPLAASPRTKQLLSAEGAVSCKVLLATLALAVQDLVRQEGGVAHEGRIDIRWPAGGIALVEATPAAAAMSQGVNCPHTSPPPGRPSRRRPS